MKQLYKINNNKFNSIYISLNYTMKVNKEELSRSALLASIMGKSSKKYKSQLQIEEYLSSLYGSNFDVNVQKIGDLYSIEFRLECVNKKFLPNNVDVLDDCIKFLYEVVYNPNIENGEFDKELIEKEKNSILQKIYSKKDDKTAYAVHRTEQLLCKNEIAGEFLFGDENIVKNISSSDLINQYNNMINDSCITIILSGNLDGYDKIDEKISNIFNDKVSSKYSYSDLIVNLNKNKNTYELHEEFELQETAQSVITFGMRVIDPKMEDFYTLNVYNAILGSTPSSKLFQNFREKESLAYTVRSRYYRFKNIIIIYAGIEKKNYDKAKQVIYDQLSQISQLDISKEEFEAAKQSILSDLVEWEDSKIAIAKMLFSNLFAFKNDMVNIEEMCNNIQKVSLDDIKEISNRIKVEQIYLLGGETDVQN